ncbi:MAG: methyltransferase domain-containing protein [Pyrinomonadaceae bacterium]
MTYDKIADRYDRAIAPLERMFLSEWRRETLDLLPENSELLEIGAGTGLNFRFYPKCRQSVAGEISCKMLGRARGKLPDDTVSLVQTDAENLPFAVNSFDAAFATLVFCALPNPEKGLAELKRVVRHEGRIVLLEHVRPPGLRGYFFDLLNLVTAPLFDDHFNRRTADLAEKAGLKILEVRKKAFGVVNLIVCQVKK